MFIVGSLDFSVETSGAFRSASGTVLQLSERISYESGIAFRHQVQTVQASPFKSTIQLKTGGLDYFKINKRSMQKRNE